METRTNSTHKTFAFFIAFLLKNRQRIVLQDLRILYAKHRTMRFSTPQARFKKCESNPKKVKRIRWFFGFFPRKRLVPPKTILSMWEDQRTGWHTPEKGVWGTVSGTVGNVGEELVTDKLSEQQVRRAFQPLFPIFA